MRLLRSLRLGSLALTLLAAGCNSGIPNEGAPTNSDDLGTGSTSDGGAENPPAGDDGTPTRKTCTNRFGKALTAAHGRLDGLLVSTALPGTHGCNSDSDHLHLQVQAGGAVYDIAVTMVDSNGADVLTIAKDLPLPDAYLEGWHEGSPLDYTTLGLHDADFTAMDEPTLLAHVQDELKTVNHISVYATGYGPTGAHLVHRNGNQNDGAIVINPLSPTAHWLFFHFANQSF